MLTPIKTMFALTMAVVFYGFGCDGVQASISFIATVFGIKNVGATGILTFVTSSAGHLLRTR